MKKSLNRDIFEDMRQRLGCLYISDLHYKKNEVREELNRLCLSEYPKKQLEDFFWYVFKVRYADMEDLLQ